MGHIPSSISNRIDKARLALDLAALEEIIEATPGCLNGPARVLAFQLLDTIGQSLKRHNLYADARLELSIAVRAIPPRVEDPMKSKFERGALEIYHCQVRESIAHLRSMLDERSAVPAA
jgi:hypothetical protein